MKHHPDSARDVALGAAPIPEDATMVPNGGHDAPFGQEAEAGGRVTSSGVFLYSGSMLIASGPTLSGETVGANETEYVLGGTAINTMVTDGGQQLVSSGGIALATTVSDGGSIVVSSGGTASFTVLQPPAGESALEETIASGGSDISAFIGSGADQYVQSGGSALATSIGAGGTQALTGMASGALVESAGTQFVDDGGTAIATTVQSGGEQVENGGTDSGTVVHAGGFLYDDFSTTVSAVLSGGSELVMGGVAMDTTVLSGGDVQLEMFGTAISSVIDAGGAQSIDPLATASGTVIGSGGFEYVDGAVSNDGYGASPGYSISAVVLSGGTEVVEPGADPYLPGGQVNDLQLSPGGFVDFTQTPFVASATVTFDAGTDQVEIIDGGQVTAFLQLAGAYSNAYFGQQSDGLEGTELTLTEGTPCYCRGTRILTDAGEIPVEDLRIGDRLITKSGESRALRWIGRRSYAGRFATANRDVLPVVFRAGCLPGGVPTRDLAVSPLHAMYLEGVLVPAACLINGSTILQVERVDQVEYFHLELASHDVIIAEGALSETYLDDDNRNMFHNAAEFHALYPDASPQAAGYCAPRISEGDLLHEIRLRVSCPDLSGPAAPPLHGQLDLVDRQRIAGWATDATGAPVRLVVRANGVAIACLTADRPRPDVAAHLGTDGLCGFDHVITGGLAPTERHVVQLCRADDGAELPGSPWLLQPAAAPLRAPAAPLRGGLEHADRSEARGWAFDTHTAPVDIQILDNGVLAGRILANAFRADLADASEGHGRHGFTYRFAAPLSPAIRHVIEARRATDGAALPGSPVVIEPAAAFDSALEHAVAQAVAALQDNDRARVLTFLSAQSDRLRQRAADAQAGRTAPTAPRRALVIDADLPVANRDAGSQAILSHAQSLRRLGFAVSLVAARQMEADPAPLAAMGIEICAAPFYASVEDVLRRQSGCFDLIYLHRAEIADAYLPLARAWMPRARVVYAVADLHHLRLARQAEIEQRPELHAAARRLRAIELSAAARADAVITHSPIEAAMLRQALPHATVIVAPWHVPARPRPPGFARRQGVAFIGSYAHAPNVDAARYLVEDIMPLVWAQDPTIPCLLAGPAMPPVIRALAAPNVELLGHVPDLATLFARIRLTAAPLRFGAGIKGKVLESWSAGIPCVLSPIAAEGLHPQTETIGATAAALATMILHLHTHQAANRAAAQTGRHIVKTVHSAAAVDAALARAAARSRGCTSTPTQANPALRQATR